MHHGLQLLAFRVAVPPSLHPALVPPHIDGFLVQTDFRVSRFSVVGAAREQRSPDVAQQSRAELELTLALRGRAQVLVGAQRAVIETGMMAWILPRKPHLILDASEDFLAWVVVFRRRLVRRVCTTAASRPLRARSGHGVLQRRIGRPEVEALAALYADVPVGAGRDVFNAGLAYALTRSWLAYQRAPQEADAAAVHPSVSRAAWLLRDGDTALSNDDLAARVGLSPQRLSRLFKQQMGTNLVDFRNRQRIDRVLAALGRPGDDKLTTLALDAGFGSYSQFHRAFRQRIGCAPAEYLRRQRLVGR